MTVPPTRARRSGAALWLCALALAGLAASCDDEAFDGRTTEVPVDQEDVLRIIDTECVACHAGVDAAGGLDLSSDVCGRIFDGLTVVPGAPFASQLYLRLVSPSAPMPPDAPLPAEDIALVKAWIEQGAACDREPFVDSGPIDGPELYARSCAGCHGASGEGGAGPAMATVAAGLDAAGVAAVAQAGSGTMPGVIADEQEALLVGAYVVETWGGG